MFTCSLLNEFTGALLFVIEVVCLFTCKWRGSWVWKEDEDNGRKRQSGFLGVRERERRDVREEG